MLAARASARAARALRHQPLPATRYGGNTDARFGAATPRFHSSAAPGATASAAEAEEPVEAVAAAAAGTDIAALKPSEVVKVLDSYIVGQNDAKRAVAIALRNRWRR